MKVIEYEEGISNDGVIVLAATNIPWAIHPAIRKVLGKRIYVPLPDNNSRIDLLKYHLRRTPHELVDEDFAYLAERTEGYTCADISIVVRDASFEPLRMAQMTNTFKITKMTPEGEPVYEPCVATDPDAKHMKLFDLGPNQLAMPKITIGNFESVFNRCKSSVFKEDIERQEKFRQEYGSLE